MEPNDELMRMASQIAGAELKMPQENSRKLGDVNGAAQNLQTRRVREMTYEDEEGIPTPGMSGRTRMIEDEPVGSPIGEVGGRSAPRPARRAPETVQVNAEIQSGTLEEVQLPDPRQKVTNARGSAVNSAAARPRAGVEESTQRREVPNRDPRQNTGSTRQRSMQQGAEYKGGNVKTPKPVPGASNPKTRTAPQQEESPKGLAGLNPKILMIGGGCVIVIIIAIAIAFSKGGKKNDTPTQEPVVEQPVVQEPVAQQPVVQNWWETDPNWSGFLDETGNPIMNDTMQSMESDTESSSDFQYTDEQLAALRAAGYTAREIEKHEAQETDADMLITEAAQAQKDWAKKINNAIIDGTWSGFSETWLALEEREDVADFNSYIMIHQETKNFDYEKIPVRGNQIFIKVYLDDLYHEDYFFMQVEPNEYAALNSEGNILVTYHYIHPTILDEDGIETEDTSRMFIVDSYQVTITD